MSEGTVTVSKRTYDEMKRATMERCYHCSLGEHIMSDEKDEHGNPIPDLVKARDVTCPGDCIVLELQWGVLT